MSPRFRELKDEINCSVAFKVAIRRCEKDTVKDEDEEGRGGGVELDWIKSAQRSPCSVDINDDNFIPSLQHATKLNS